MKGPYATETVPTGDACQCPDQASQLLIQKTPSSNDFRNGTESHDQELAGHQLLKSL